MFVLLTTVAVYIFLSVRSTEDNAGAVADECVKTVFLDSNGVCAKPELENYADTCGRQRETSSEKPLTFENPEYLWGEDYNRSTFGSVCDASGFTRWGGDPERNRFTLKGTMMCSELCNRQKQNVLHVAPTTVLLRDSYCTKSSSDEATCVCVFKISCHVYTYYAFVHVVVNGIGEVATLYFEIELPVTVDFGEF